MHTVARSAPHAVRRSNWRLITSMEAVMLIVVNSHRAMDGYERYVEMAGRTTRRFRFYASRVIAKRLVASGKLSQPVAMGMTLLASVDTNPDTVAYVIRSKSLDGTQPIVIGV